MEAKGSGSDPIMGSELPRQSGAAEGAEHVSEYEGCHPCEFCGQMPQLAVVSDPALVGWSEEGWPESYDHSSSRARMPDGRPALVVDACLVNALEEMWGAGIRTFFSCCGHGEREGQIQFTREVDQ